jgi:hypothetical protein
MAVRGHDRIGVLFLLLALAPSAARADAPSSPANGSPSGPARVVIRPIPPRPPTAPDAAVPKPPPVSANPSQPPDVRVPSASFRATPFTLRPPAAASAEANGAARGGAPSSTLFGVVPRDFVMNQVVAAVPAGQATAAIADDYGLAVADEAVIGSLGLRLVTFTLVRPRGLADVIDQMGLDPRVGAAQPNFRYRPSAAVTTYPHTRTRLEPAHGLASGAGVTVALIDTKVADLPSLSRHIAERVSLVKNGSAAWRHGTAVAGLIADVAPAARLIAIEAFDDEAGAPDSVTATTIVLVRAIDAALTRNAAVINLSLSGPRDPLIGRMVRQALARGAVVVAAAGNDGPDAGPRYPAAYDGVVAVTAVDSHDQIYAAAGRGPHIAIAAPGVDVAVELPGGKVGYISGTSLAAAQVAGVAALLRERAPGLGSADARKVLTETATALPDGPGVVNAFAAVSRVTALTRR